MPPRDTNLDTAGDEQPSAGFTLAHLSDLHLGSGPGAEQGAAALVRAVEEGRVDHAVLSGDVTHRGRRQELDLFHALFGELLARGALTVVPGNHDRMNDDVAPALMPGARVQRRSPAGTWMVLLDSTAEFNRSLHLGHGQILREDLDALDRALADAPVDVLRVVALHHHPLPLPTEDLGEVLSCWLGLPWCAELQAGRALLEVLRGRCDLVLHGHRHVPSEQRVFSSSPRPLRIFNAGRSPELGRFRVFRHSGGALAAGPEWVEARPPALARAG